MGRTTISATGDDAGFTLLEILLALAVIGLIATVLIGGSARLLATKPLTPEQVFWDGVRRARKAALEHDDVVHLSFDEKLKQFVIVEGQATKDLPIPGAQPDLEIDFLPGATPPPGAMPGLAESTFIPSVNFNSDGTCTPFRLQIRTAVSTRQVGVDPWTCAKMLPPLATNGTPTPTS